VLYDVHRFEPAAERLEFIDSLLADNKYLFPVPEHVDGGVRGPNPSRESQKLLTNGQHPLYFLLEAIPRFIYNEYYHQANNRG
jgi:hypothetical protein